MYCSAGPSIETPAARTHPRIKALAICVDHSCVVCVVVVVASFFIIIYLFSRLLRHEKKTIFLAGPVESEYNERTSNAVAGCCWG